MVVKPKTIIPTCSTVAEAKNESIVVKNNLLPLKSSLEFFDKIYQYKNSINNG